MPRAVCLLVEMVKVEDPDPFDIRSTALELREIAGERVVGVTLAARFTLPANPLTLARVRVDPPEEPREMVSEPGLAEMVKSAVERTV